jgi:predicted alpha/beta-fold hydrolase
VTERRLRSKVFGLYNANIQGGYYEPYGYQGFAKMERFPRNEILSQLKTIYDIDALTRAPALGYKSVEDLMKGSSCGNFISDIDIPFLVVQAKDD